MSAHYPKPLSRLGKCDSNVLEEMKKKIIIIIGIGIVAFGVVVIIITAFIIRNKTVLPPSVIGEFTAPMLISDDAWRASIANDPTADGYSGYGILADRKSDIAITEGLRDLSSDDPYIWMNAASYLGSRGRSESIPYLIKALRHSAWRSDDDRVEQLRRLTGQSFGENYSEWHLWYEAQPDQIVIDWESSLGHSPRLPK